jgi:hypothetical protein
VSLRPANAVWFAMLMAREDLAFALARLASSREVELESQSHASVAELVPRLRSALDEYGRLAQRYASYWPNPSLGSVEPTAELDMIAADALEHLRAWALAAEPLVAELQKLEHERTEIAYLERLLWQSTAPLPAFNLLVDAGPVLAGRIYLLEPSSGTLILPEEILAQRIDCVGHSYLLAVGPTGQIQTLDEGLNALKARRLVLPATVGGEDPSARLETRLAQIARTTHRLRAHRPRLVVASARAALEIAGGKPRRRQRRHRHRTRSGRSGELLAGRSAVLVVNPRRAGLELFRVHCLRRRSTGRMVDSHGPRLVLRRRDGGR